MSIKIRFTSGKEITEPGAEDFAYAKAENCDSLVVRLLDSEDDVIAVHAAVRSVWRVKDKIPV
jgi:hypothetical protein